MRESTILAAVEGGRWRPGIGDPTVMGWVTVAAYLVAALCCLRAAWREPRPDGTRQAGPVPFWLILGGLLVALGINKQLDLQSLITQVGRDAIKALDLYRQRRMLQSAFILAIAVACGLALGAFVWTARRSLRRRGPALVGMLFVLGFVVIRAASFHHVDAFLAARLGGLKWNWVLELGGIAVIGVAAFCIAPGRPPRPENAMTYRYRINPK